jgi:hypothetical protein
MKADAQLMKADAQRQLLVWRKCKSICLYQADALIKAGSSDKGRHNI